ncbi:hypothetical protein [Nocardia fluminea]|uniref:Uncharacterized protein n=1 Tax=Nocardia fluminea TaxID=134984 RepID=A0A2N3WY14_9NOCA|nr:hypothetical protein [Nocardia fluminea]PKV98745.1 hypothetical protein ATK86_0773 [Nocardia fluminea]
MPAKPRRNDHRFTPTAITEIADYREGASSNQLCKQYGLSKDSLVKILREHGIQTRLQPMTQDEVDRAAALYEAGDRRCQTRQGKGQCLESPSRSKYPLASTNEISSE